MSLLDARIGLPNPRKDPEGYGSHLFEVFAGAAVGDFIQTPRSLVQKISDTGVKTIEKRDGPYPHYKWGELVIPEEYIHPN